MSDFFFLKKKKKNMQFRIAGTWYPQFDGECTQNTHPWRASRTLQSSQKHRSHVCLWLKHELQRHLCAHENSRHPVRHVTWSVPHLLSSSPPQHEAPLGQHDLPQNDTVHRAPLPKTVRSTSSALEPPSHVNYESGGNPRNTSPTFKKKLRQPFAGQDCGMNSSTKSDRFIRFVGLVWILPVEKFPDHLLLVGDWHEVLAILATSKVSPCPPWTSTFCSPSLFCPIRSRHVQTFVILCILHCLLLTLRPFFVSKYVSAFFLILVRTMEETSSE